jgi:hypothetical protein
MQKLLVYGPLHVRIPRERLRSQIDRLGHRGRVRALLINAALFVLFGMQHSVMARP